MNTKNFKIDNLQYCNWSKEIFEINNEAKLDAIHVTIAYHENFNEVGKPNLANLVNYLFRVGDVNAQRYTAGNGGYPYWHSEVYPQLQHNDALHRVLLFMYYLNDVEEGGETEFYYQNRAVKPKAGRMVIAPAYFTHTHRGQIPKSNDKYILTSWLLFNRAEQIYTQG